MSTPSTPDPTALAIEQARHSEQISALIKWQTDQNGTLRDIREQVTGYRKESAESRKEMREELAKSIASVKDEVKSQMKEVEVKLDGFNVRMMLLLGGVATSSIFFAIDIALRR